MSYGEPGRGAHPWSLGREAAAPFFRQALDAGINFFDTANIYSAGSSEEIVGQTLLSKVPREEVVIATKVHGRTLPWSMLSHTRWPWHSRPRPRSGRPKTPASSPAWRRSYGSDSKGIGGF